MAMFFIACAAENERTKFAGTYAEILATRERYHDTAQANPRIRDILKQSGHTEETFRKKFTEYSQNSEEMRALFDSVNTGLQRKMEGKK